MNGSRQLCDAARMLADTFSTNRPGRAPGLCAALLCLLLPLTAQPRDHHHGLAEAVRNGEILPLTQMTDHAKKHFGGRVIEVELERKRQGARYELELLLEDGRVVELTYDATTGSLLEVEGHRLETVFGRNGRPYP
jgi:hypothetical protein